jgi:hypothetical protein
MIAFHREIALVKVKEIKGFFEEGLWQIELDDLSRIRRYLYQQLRILNLVVKGFIDNQSPLARATSGPHVFDPQRPGGAK